MRPQVRRNSLVLSGAVLVLAGFGMEPVVATTLAPPMLDISKQCIAHARRNATAMSECVVAESEARAELLQKWSKVSDASAEKCVKISKKSKKLPYSAMAQCLAAEPVEAQAPQVAPPPTPVAQAADAGKKDCGPLLSFSWIKSLRHGC